MSGTVQVNIRISPAELAAADRIARERSVSRTTVLRQALGFLQVAHDAGQRGHYVGTHPDREAFQQIIIGPL